MTVKVTKPALNLREELSSLKKPSGVAGEAMLRAETPQEQFNLIGAGRKNLIINGAMQVAQRGTSFTGYNIYTLDRWRTSVGTVPTQTISQEQQSDGTYALLMNMTSGSVSQINQRIERGCNILSGKQVTFSYEIWGSGNIDIIAGDSSSATNIYRETISIPATRTRQSVTFTVPAQTSSSDNMLRVAFECSPTTVVRITNVQLELGTVATPFEHRSYGEELALCQRYYQRWPEKDTSTTYESIFATGGHSNTYTYVTLQNMTPMRARPSTVGLSGSITDFAVVSYGIAWYEATGWSLHTASNKSINLQVQKATSIANGIVAELKRDAGASSFFYADAEL